MHYGVFQRLKARAAEESDQQCELFRGGKVGLATVPGFCDNLSCGEECHQRHDGTGEVWDDPTGPGGYGRDGGRVGVDVPCGPSVMAGVADAVDEAGAWRVFGRRAELRQADSGTDRVAEDEPYEDYRHYDDGDA